MSNLKLHNLFIAGRYDPGQNLVHSAAYLTDPDGNPVGRVAGSQAGHRRGASWSQDEGDHSAGLAAFEMGCNLAVMNGVTRVLLHAPDQVDHDVMFLAREDKSARTDADGGIDYFNVSVFVYRPGEDTVPSGWQAGMIERTGSMCDSVCESCRGDGI